MAFELIGVSNSIHQIKDQIRTVAARASRVMITGESGVGKEIVAQHLYNSSPRKGKPFIRVQFSSLPDCNNEKQLFGGDPCRRAYQADAGPGIHTYARGGILFLDGIDMLSRRLQEMVSVLLRNGHRPAEDTKAFWVIATSCSDIGEKVLSGRFREELYSQLKLIEINIPPLRQRIEDIPPLMNYFLDKFTPGNTNLQILKPGARQLRKLTRYHWPGNVWELQTVLRKFLLSGDWDETIESLLGNGSSKL